MSTNLHKLRKTGFALICLCQSHTLCVSNFMSTELSKKNSVQKFLCSVIEIPCKGSRQRKIYRYQECSFFPLCHFNEDDTHQTYLNLAKRSNLCKSNADPIIELSVISIMCCFEYRTKAAFVASGLFNVLSQWSYTSKQIKEKAMILGHFMHSNCLPYNPTPSIK